VIGNRWEKYKKKLKERGDEREDLVLDDMQILRVCCRRMFMGYAEEVEEIVESYEFLNSA
jgi:DNA-directed RNA polymerase subunit N (RpoN/RPB10)